MIFKYYGESLDVSKDMYALLTVLRCELGDINIKLRDLITACNNPPPDFSSIDSAIGELSGYLDKIHQDGIGINQND